MNVRKQSFALAKVRVALSSLMCGLASCLFADIVEFQGHEIEYANATVTRPDGVDGDVVLTFASDGTVTLPGKMTAVRVLAVGGGAAGGSGATYSSTSNAKKHNGGNGGGGGGGVAESGVVYVEPGTLVVTVGAGGAAATSGASATPGNSGGASKVVDASGATLAEAAGGGGGGSQSVGEAGGSGGGGSQSTLRQSTFSYVRQPNDGGAGIEGQGFDGGAGDATQIGAGGGGAGAAGAAASEGGAGGDGKASDITGEEVYYGGGGGGGRINGSGSVVSGGSGGGGSGGLLSSTLAGAGTDGLGGGGGGGGLYNASYPAYAIGGAGGSGIVIVRISAVYENPTKPAETCEFTYDGTEHVSIPVNAAYTITGTARTASAGVYTATATLKPELVAKGFTWTDGTTDSVEVTMTIAKASNAISGLKIESWIVGQPANNPTCTARFGTVKYTWSDSEAGPWTEYDAWTAGKRPTSVGTYYIRAAVEETNDYDGAEAIERFGVWANPSTAFTDHVTMSVNGLTSETLTDFPILVRISEDRIPGFLYSRVGAMGQELAFTSPDGTTRYPHEVDVWDASGESLVWVRVPTLTAATDIEMWWHVADGQEAPAYAPEDVWRAFAGVWHFSGTTTSALLSDASGNGLTATLDTDASVTATTGGRIGSTALVKGGSLTVADSAKLPDFSSGFSFYGWVRASEYANGSKTPFFGKTSQSAVLADSLTTGWAMRLEANNAARWMWSGGNAKQTLAANVTKTDGLLGFVYDGSASSLMECALLTSENQLYRTAAKVETDGAALQLAAGGFALDEVRLSATAFSSAWMKAEYRTVTDPSKTTFGSVTREGLLVDWWTKEASITKTSWYAGEMVGAITAPVAASGRDVRQTFIDLSDPEKTLSGMPEAAGCYRVKFDFEDDEEMGYEPLTASLDFQILAKATSYDSLQGDAATLTLSGRVLLMNDDTVAGHVVTDQGYWQERRVKTATFPSVKWTTYTTFWVHSGEHSAGAANGTYRAGTDHDLMFSEVNSTETNTIWRLRNILVGSPYTTKDGALGSRCALPFSATARQISVYGNRTKLASADLREVGNVVFRNMEGAAVYSQCYSNGVGTVYFDAVNLFTLSAGGSGYSLAVEVTTNVTDGVSGADFPDESVWTPVKLMVLRRDVDSDSGFALVSDDVDSVDMNATSGGDDFYRVAAKVEIRQPCRFRIRRVSVVSGFGVDGLGFILADNIVVSYPRMTAEVMPFGEFDAARFDGGAVGCAGAMSVPFPGVGATVSARAKVDAWTGATADADPESFISVSRLNYRWRYLDQKVGEWKQSLLTPDGAGGLKAFEPLDLPAAEGDVEFWFESSVSIPYYEFFDYSGTGLGMGGHYSETAGDTQTNRLSLASGETLPSCGRDWFFRIRPLTSAYERMRVITAETDDGPATTNEMELAASGSWRGFVPTLSVPADGMLRFRIEGVNPQADGAAEYAFATNAWVASEALAETPAETGLATWTSGWSKAPCDAKTGFLLFQIDEPSAESAGKLLVARADRQDFNLWSSGISTNGLFVGTSVDTNSTTQVTQTRTLDFAALALSVATNTNWSEDFSLGSTNIASRVFYPRNEPFTSYWTTSSGVARTSTMHGWTPQNAMWTYGHWAEESVKGLGDATALQLQGRGMGAFSFVGASDAPDGLDTVSFTARLAQYNTCDDFAYFDDIRQKRFTLLTQLAMTESGASSFDGDGSVSLVGYLHPQYGGYEFRISRSSKSATLRLALYKWAAEGRALKPTLLGSADMGATTNLVSDNATALGVAYISVSPDGTTARPKTRVVCGLYDGALSPLSGGSAGGYRLAVDGKNFKSIAYVDASAPLTAGTYGVLARNCPGVFVSPLSYAAPALVTEGGSEPALSDNTFKSIPTSVVTFDGEPVQRSDMDYWILKSGRTEALSGHGGCWGMQAVTNISQKIMVETSPCGAGTWKAIATNEVTSFADQTFRNVVRTPDTCDVRFHMFGNQDDERVDVVLREVELTQWAAQTTPGFSTDSQGRTNDFVYTQAWVVDGSGKNRSVRLQPARASNASKSVALRTPALNGLGLVGFSWRNADENAVLLLQYATNSSPRVFANNCRTLTEAASDGDGWVTLETMRFADMEEAVRASGHRTVPLAVRAPSCGAFRLVLDKSVVSAARGSAGKADPLYGSVEIVELYAWDLPAYDARSWTGWNFRTAGWADRAPGAFANLRDAWTGLSGLLNNTLDEDTLADKEPEHYALRQPSVQSPTFVTNCVGSVEFRARLYDEGDPTAKSPCAVVTVYGADLVDENGEPTHWESVGDVLVTNSVYEVYSMRFSNSRNFYALRLGVKGVGGVFDRQVEGSEKPVYDPPLRVAIDDVVVWEKSPLAVAFRRNHVRPFRSATALKGTGIVEDVDSAEEQPIAGETFGFQAEVVVRDTDEIVLDDPSRPISVTLWYYPSAEPWGFDSWKTNSGAVSVKLDAADGTNLIFRSTMEKSRSMCPPQQVGSGGYGVVQYQMVATFYDRNGEEFTQPMSASEWSMPSWNEGFDDPNAKTGTTFSAFTVLETIAPGRAWINEVNYVEGTSQDTSSVDQWIELAIPSGVNMTNWTVRLYDRLGERVATLVTLGRDCPGVKSFAPVNHYEFYVVKSPWTTSLPSADATWARATAYTTSAIDDGRLARTNPFGFELVRPSGIVEHRVVTQGDNIFREYGYSNDYVYDGTNLVRVLDEATTGGWVWGEEDKRAYPGCTLGVTNGQGRVHADWYSPMGCTPGGLNQGQVIDPDWFTRPNSGFCWVDAVVSGAHLRQVVGGVTNTTASFSVESGKSTNLVYEVDRWYRLGEPTVVPATTATTVSGPVAKGGMSYYTLTFPELTNDVRVVASAIVDPAVEPYLADAGAYRPAIMKWLEEFDGDTIKLGKYRGGSGELDDDLTLKAHYWLDVDPTEGGWELWGNMGEKGGTTNLGNVDEPAYRYKDSLPTHTNIQTTVWLMLTNTVSGAAHPPYRLQGLGNEQSDTYSGVWTSATFKVEMQLLGGDDAGVWRPMRYFVFDGGSFRPANDDKAPFAARIEVTDPFSRQSPAWEWGWWKYPTYAPVTRWNLNEDISPGGVSTLKANDELTY